MEQQKQKKGEEQKQAPLTGIASKIDSLFKAQIKLFTSIAIEERLVKITFDPVICTDEKIQEGLEKLQSTDIKIIGEGWKYNECTPFIRASANILTSKGSFQGDAEIKRTISNLFEKGIESIEFDELVIPVQFTLEFIDVLSKKEKSQLKELQLNIQNVEIEAQKNEGYANLYEKEKGTVNAENEIKKFKENENLMKQEKLKYKEALEKAQIAIKQLQKEIEEKEVNIVDLELKLCEEQQNSLQLQMKNAMNEEEIKLFKTQFPNFVQDKSNVAAPQ